MAEKRISELTAKGSNLQSTDLIEVSVDAGGGSYATRYITGAQITGAVSSANFANTNLTFTGNRTHDLDGYSLTFNDIVDFKVNSFTTGYKCGFYDIGNSIPEFILDCGAGGQSIFHYRNNGVDVAVYKTIGSAHWIQAKETQVRDYTTNYIQTIKNTSGEWLFTLDSTGLETPEANVRMKVIAASGQTALKTVGKVNFNTLPTSSVGLASGDLWNDSGTIKIV
jgi:hypothetical protein